VTSFAREFSRQYRYWREGVIRRIVSKIRSASEEKLKHYYEQILGEEPEPFQVEPEITLSDDRVVAMVPAGTMNKKAEDEELDRVRKGLARLYRARPKRRVKVKPMKYYKGKAKNGVVRIGKASYDVKRVISAIRALGKDCYMYPPQRKDSVLILENENGDRVFIAPVVKD